MKKITTLLIINALFISSIFADNFFSQRFFEIKVDVPVDISNNTIGITDFLQEEILIDLNEFANTMPDDGLMVTISANPQVEMNVNLKALKAGGGVNAGVEVFGQIGLSKDIFNFLCNGNDIGDEIKVEGLVRADAFAYSSVDAYFKLGKFNFTVTPTFFVPLVHTYTNTAKASVQNTEDGQFIVDLDGQAKVYSFMDVGNAEMNYLINGGFDLGASVKYNMSKFLGVTGSIRMPIAPGTLNYCSTESFGFHYETSLNDLMNGTTSENNTPFSSEIGEWTAANYKINRPFKLNGLVEFKPIGNLITIGAGAGFGVRNPFSAYEDEVKLFGEYYLGAKVSLLGIFGAQISTEYTNQIFKHQAGASLNLRLFELDIGASSQSANFSTSFKLAGVGAYVNFAFGL